MQSSKKELSSLHEMLDLSPRERAVEQLKVLQTMMITAIKQGKFKDALDIFSQAKGIIHREGKK